MQRRSVPALLPKPTKCFLATPSLQELEGLHLLAIRFLPLDQTATFEAYASKQPPGFAVGEDRRGAPQGHVPFQIPAKPRGLHHRRGEALHRRAAT